jgi:putative Holliday junction resolvase
MGTGRVLGLDIGKKWVGIALSDPGGILASPLTRISAVDTPATVEAICKLAREHEVVTIVAGMPYSLNGTIGHQAKQVQDFVQTLSQCVGVPVETWDERLSTVVAEQKMTEAGVGDEERRGKVDAAAAAVILQGYLDRSGYEQRE